MKIVILSVATVATYWACDYAYHAGYAYHQAGGVL